MRIISHAQFNNAGFPNGPVNPCVVGDFGQNGTYSRLGTVLQKTILL